MRRRLGKVSKGLWKHVFSDLDDVRMRGSGKLVEVPRVHDVVRLLHYHRVAARYLVREVGYLF